MGAPGDAVKDAYIVSMVQAIGMTKETKHGPAEARHGSPEPLMGHRLVWYRDLDIQW